MKISVPRQDPLSLPYGEQPENLLCRQYSGITSTVEESLAYPRGRHQQWWSRLGPGPFTDCFRPDNGVISSVAFNDALSTKESLKCIQPSSTANNIAFEGHRQRDTEPFRNFSVPEDAGVVREKFVERRRADPSSSTKESLKCIQPSSTTNSIAFEGHRQRDTEPFRNFSVFEDAGVVREKFVERRRTDPSSSDEDHGPGSSVLVSECHCEAQSSKGTSDVPRVKLMCSFGGRIMARPVDGKLRYVGGETRIVSACKGISFTEFMSKMSQFYGSPLGLKYQLPDEDLDSLISVSSDDDLQNMMEEIDKIGPSGVSGSRLRLFFFSTPSDVELAESKLGGTNSSSSSDQRYVDAINGLNVKNQANQPEGDTAALHPSVAVDSADGGGRISSLEQANEVTVHCSAIPSSPPSPLASGPSGQRIFRKPPGLLDLSFQNLNDGLCKASMAPFGFEQETDQDNLGSSISTPFHYRYDPSHVDLQFSQAMDSPRVSPHDGSSSRNDNLLGLRRVDSQSKLMRLHDRQNEYRSSVGAAPELWHEATLVRDISSPCGDHQRANQQNSPSLSVPHQSYNPHPQQIKHQLQYQHQHQRYQLSQHHLQQQYYQQQQHDYDYQSNQHQPQPQPQRQYLHQQQQQQQHYHGYKQHQLHQHQQQSWYLQSEGDAGRGEDAHKHHQHHQLPFHHLVHNAAGHDGFSWNAEHHGTPRSTQPNTRMSHVLAPAPLHQMGSISSSPRVAVYDYQGKCPCGLQQSQVHRGITVSIGEQPYAQPYARLPSFQGDQGAWKQGLRSSSRFCDNSISTWQQANNSILTGEVEHTELGKYFPVSHGRHQRDVQSTDCSARNQNVRCTEPLSHHGENLPSLDQPESSTRCMCARCVDTRRHDMEAAMANSAYSEASDHIADWSLPWRGFDLDGERVVTGQNLHARACAMKDEEQNNVSEVEMGLCISQLPGGPDSKLTMVAHVDRSKKMQLSSGAVASSSTMFDEPILPLAPRAAELSLNLTKPSLEFAMSSCRSPSEQRCYYDILSCQQGQPMQLGKDLTMPVVIESLSGATRVEDTDENVMLSEANNGAAMSISFSGDKAFGGAGRVESDAGHLWSPNCGLDSGDQWRSNVLLAGPGDSHNLSPDVISLDSVVEVGKSGQMLTSSSFDQTPFRSTDVRSFPFAGAGKPLVPPTEMIFDREPFAFGMSVTGQMADSMASKILDETIALEISDVDKDTAYSPKGEESVAKAKEDSQMVCAEANISKAQLSNGGGSGLMIGQTLEGAVEALMDKSGAANGFLEANVTGDSGPARAVPSGGSNKISYKEEVVDAIKNAPAVSEAEAEAIAHGLQIIKNSDLEDMKELGSGTYGTVYHGKWRGTDVAIKRIKASCFTDTPSDRERLIADFWREACTLGQLHHPNVVAFYGVVPDGPGGTLATVTEYMVNGSLKKVLHKKDRTIDRRKRLFIAMDVAFGMEYLHSKNIVHFDLKCENLLVNMRDAHRPVCKVGDFGLSKVKHHTLVSGGVRGTLPWMAPELLNGHCGMVSEKVDVFSFGIVMWELLTGEEPYANMRCGAIIGGIASNSLRPTIPSWCDPGWRSLMERCWSGNPAERPAFAEVAKELRSIAATMNLK